MSGPTPQHLATQRQKAAKRLNDAIRAIGQGKWNDAESATQDGLDAIRRSASIAAALAKAGAA